LGKSWHAPLEEKEKGESPSWPRKESPPEDFRDSALFKEEGHDIGASVPRKSDAISHQFCNRAEKEEKKIEIPLGGKRENTGTPRKKNVVESGKKGGKEINTADCVRYLG